jgi:regulator of sirC expression with transglutaminase-like and TPR domain
MKRTAAPEPAPEALSAGQRAALVNLLGDEDPAVYTRVRDEILRFGPNSAEWLRPHLTHREPAVRRRAKEIIHYFDVQAADNRFLAFCLQNGEEFDLEAGAWLLAQSGYPEINPEGYRALLDCFAGEIRHRCGERAPAKKVLTCMNEYLFGELGFSGDNEHYYDPQNSYLNRVIDRRMGIPISLCLIYYLLGRRLQLPLTGIGLPGRFICRYQSSAAEIYIDVFDSGTFLTKADCVQYLLRTNFSVRDDYLAPVSSRRFLLRMCANLHQVYTQQDRSEEATRLQRYLVALAR